MSAFKRNVLYLLVPFVLICIFFAGCSGRTDKDKTAIRINDYSLSAGEFDSMFSELSPAEDSPETRRLFLDNLINRKLLLQQAQKEGIDKEDDFLKSIESFWEQSLLKIVVDNKIKSITKETVVTEQEVRDKYAKWLEMNPDNPLPLNEVRNVIMHQLLKEKQAKVLGSWIDDLKKNANINIDKKALGID